MQYQYNCNKRYDYFRNVIGDYCKHNCAGKNGLNIKSY